MVIRRPSRVPLFELASSTWLLQSVSEHPWDHAFDTEFLERPVLPRRFFSAGMSENNSSEILDHTNPNHWRNNATQNPNIAKLNRDILWRVFSLNVIDLADNIVTLRRTSQVCSSWRNLALSSSSLWGQAVNVTTMGRARDEWVQEVIRRTGQAPLHIQDFCDTALLGDRRTAAITILEDLFKHHWKRIKSIILARIRLDFDQEPAFEELLQQPAPYLEVFRVCLSNPDTTLCLFANHAPSLKECELSHLAFTTQAQWLRNLRQLHACSYRWFQQREERLITPNQLLDALACMPFLDTFEGLDRCTLDLLDAAISLPNIILPRLADIYVRSGGNALACIAVLRHITPATGCRFRIDFIRTEGFIFTTEEITSLYSLFSKYFENYIKIYPISNISIHFNARGRGAFMVQAGYGDFYFSLDLASPLLFAKSFFSDENLRHFLSLLENAEVLNITHHALPLFLRLRNDNSTAILPRLRRLFMPAEWRKQCVEFHYIFLFLEWRCEIGLPLESIHLPLPTDRVDIHYNLSDLDKFTGLEVEWEEGAGKYLCAVVILISLYSLCRFPSDRA